MTNNSTTIAKRRYHIRRLPHDRSTRIAASFLAAGVPATLFGIVGLGAYSLLSSDVMTSRDIWPALVVFVQCLWLAWSFGRFGSPAFAFLTTRGIPADDLGAHDACHGASIVLACLPAASSFGAAPEVGFERTSRSIPIFPSWPTTKCTCRSSGWRSRCCWRPRFITPGFAAPSRPAARPADGISASPSS